MKTRQQQGSNLGRNAALILGIALAAFVGCQGETENGDQAGGEGSEISSQVKAENDESPVGVEIALEIKSWDEIEAWVEAQKGKVVVIDLWTTMCLPCMKEFPNFVEFHRELGDQVACASVSLDFVGGEGGVPDEVVDRVQAFLKDQESTMANFVCSDPDESVLARFEHYSVPVSLVFDAEGELARVFKEDDSQEVAKPFTYKDDIGPFVKTLLE